MVLRHSFILSFLLIVSNLLVRYWFSFRGLIFILHPLVYYSVKKAETFYNVHSTFPRAGLCEKV
ncbi:unnamed protein product, partial [Vitis vinifera]